MESEPTPLAETARSRRLSIAHLLWFTLSTAAMFAAHGVLSRYYPTFQSRDAWERVHQTIFTLGYGAALGAIGLFVWWRLRGRIVRFQPGHWLILILAVGALLDLAIAVVLGNWGPREHSMNISVHRSICSGVVALFIIWPITYTWNDRWRWSFVAVGLACTCMSALDASFALDFLVVRKTGFVAGHMLIVAGITVFFGVNLVNAVLDWRYRVRRDWLHALGLLSTCSLAVCYWIGTMWNLVRWW